jgi:ComF family protein
MHSRQYSQRLDRCQPNERTLVDRFAGALARLWPARCVLCLERTSTGIDLCVACTADLPLNAYGCTRCAQPLNPSAAGLLCGACTRKPPWFHAIVPYRYDYPIAHLIRQLKYGGDLACARVLGDLVAAYVARTDRADHWPALLIPVPLGARRYATRGYNQANEIALRLSRALRIPIARDLLVRTRETAEQAGLDARERRRNLRGAFTVVGSPPPHVAIVDDVITTGSTIREIAKVLRRAGARRIEVWAVARAGSAGARG